MEEKKTLFISLENFCCITITGYVYFQMLHGFHPLLLINGRKSMQVKFNFLQYFHKYKYFDNDQFHGDGNRESNKRHFHGS